MAIPIQPFVGEAAFSIQVAPESEEDQILPVGK
jgi:hypothetical protein